MGRCLKIMSGLLTGLLAFIFITAGTIKVTPKLSVEAHKRVVSIKKISLETLSRNIVYVSQNLRCSIRLEFLFKKQKLYYGEGGLFNSYRAP